VVGVAHTGEAATDDDEAGGGLIAGRPRGSRNRHPTTSHDVGKTVKRDRTITERRQRTG
jgi:hypothetical protein